ncbi:MAG: MarR family transcriptional regulator [Myxococcota bacterium]
MADSSLIPGLDEQLCFALYSTSHAFTRAYKSLLGPLDLTYPQYMTLIALWNGDDQTVQELGGQLFLESNTLTPLLKRLEGKGLLTRTRDPADERRVRVRLTEAGHALQAQAAHVPICIQQASGVGLSDAAALLEVLHALGARLRGAKKK